jgi:hypothetical protein
MDAIPKEGGNVFSDVSPLWSTKSLQQDNITPELRPFIRAGDNGFSTTATALGGPLRHDRFWYFWAMRVSQSNLVANTFSRTGGR